MPQSGNDDRQSVALRNGGRSSKIKWFCVFEGQKGEESGRAKVWAGNCKVWEGKGKEEEKAERWILDGKGDRLIT